MSDLISSQAAIEALDAFCDRECEYSKQHRSFMCGVCRLGSAFDVINALPSAQPEPIKINIEDFNKEDWERLKKEWGNTPITVLPSAQETREERTDCSK